MPNRNWLVIAALGLALAFVSGPLAQEVSNDPATGGSTTEEAAQPSQQPQPPPTITIQDALDRIATALEANNNADNTTEEDERAKRDLAAQENMAWWAMWMVWTAVASILIGGASLVLIWQTVRFTRDAAVAGQIAATAGQVAAVAAEEAVEEARKATMAARESTQVAVQANTMSREAIEIQNRAYLGVNSIDCGLDYNRVSGLCNVRVTITVINGGATPARQIHSQVKIAWHLKDEYTTGLLLKKDVRQLHDVMAGKDATVINEVIKLSDSESARLIDHSLYLSVTGTVSYRTVVVPDAKRMSFAYRVERDGQHISLKAERATHGNKAS